LGQIEPRGVTGKGNNHLFPDTTCLWSRADWKYDPRRRRDRTRRRGDRNPAV